jgi:protein O-GlcNAc transferase
LSVKAQLAQWFDEALRLHHCGKFQEAIPLYKKIDKLDPENPIVLQNLGLALVQTGGVDRGLHCLDRAEINSPNSPDIPFNKAIVLFNLGRPNEALTSLVRAISIEPDFREALETRASILFQLGEFNEALTVYASMINKWPKLPELYNYKATCLGRLGRFDEAFETFERSLELAPLDANTYVNRANILFEQSRFNEALADYDKSIKLGCTDPTVYINKASALAELELTEDAIECLNVDLQIEDNAETLCRKAAVLAQLGEFEEASLSYDRALAVDQTDAKIYIEAGMLQAKLGHLWKANNLYQLGLALTPDDSLIHECLGRLHAARGSHEEAAQHFEKAVELDPKSASATASLLQKLTEFCDWDRAGEIAARMDHFNKQAIIENHSNCEDPFDFIARCDDQSAILELTQAYCQKFSSSKKIIEPELRRSRVKVRSDKLKLGYVTSDLADSHPVGQLIASLFGLHNREKFEVGTFSFGRNFGGEIRDRVARESDFFEDLSNLSTGAAVQAINRTHVDLLIDLNGHTAGSNMEIFARRPAPVQVSFLGYTGTTGADFMDYIILDEISVPPDQGINFTENIVYLPHTFLLNDYTQFDFTGPASRVESGLSEENFVFCSFNAPHKIEPVMFSSWINILHEVPSSVLWLLESNKQTETNLKKQAIKLGIDADRLVFAPRVDKTAHLARIAMANLALDTRIFGGHATTADALWAGVPVLSLLGTHFASRAASSILSSVGLSELITYSLEEYQRTAIYLAKHADKLENIREKLASNKGSAPLFDTPRYVKNLERAYEKIWASSFQKAPAKILKVEEGPV